MDRRGIRAPGKDASGRTSTGSVKRAVDPETTRGGLSRSRTTCTAREKGEILVQVAVLIDLNRLYGTQTKREFVTGVPPFTDPKERLLLHKVCEIARGSCR